MSRESFSSTACYTECGSDCFNCAYSEYAQETTDQERMEALKIIKQMEAKKAQQPLKEFNWFDNAGLGMYGVVYATDWEEAYLMARKESGLYESGMLTVPYRR